MFERHRTATIGPKPWLTIVTRGGAPGHRWCRTVHVSDSLITGQDGVFRRVVRATSLEAIDALIDEVNRV